MPNKPKVVWNVCLSCKKPYQVELRALRRGKGRFCSIRCASLYRVDRLKIGRNQAGKNNPNWRGGRTKHIKGYIYRQCPNHPRNHNGYVLEHILVAEKKLGRFLEDGETVHHINGIKDDNRPENIKVFSSTGDHTRFHAALRRVEKAFGEVAATERRESDGP